MSQIIVYENSSGGISVIYPADCGLTVEQIARKDVPAGSPYLIISPSDLPDPQYRDAWTADFSEPDGHGIGAEAWFAEQSQNNGG